MTGATPSSRPAPTTSLAQMLSSAVPGAPRTGRDPVTGQQVAILPGGALAPQERGAARNPALNMIPPSSQLPMPTLSSGAPAVYNNPALSKIPPSSQLPLRPPQPHNPLLDKIPPSSQLPTPTLSSGAPAVYNNPLHAAVRSEGGRRVYSIAMQNGAHPNEAALLAAAAGAESNYNPTLSHDNGTGYGLFGHRLERRAALFNYAGTTHPSFEQQVAFGLRELRSRPEGRMAIAARSPEELARAQMFFERPIGFTEQHPEQGHNYSGRLALTRQYFGGGGATPPAAQGPSTQRAQVFAMTPPAASPGTTPQAPASPATTRAPAASRAPDTLPEELGPAPAFPDFNEGGSQQAGVSGVGGGSAAPGLDFQSALTLHDLALEDAAQEPSQMIAQRALRAGTGLSNLDLSGLFQDVQIGQAPMMQANNMTRRG